MSIFLVLLKFYFFEIIIHMCKFVADFVFALGLFPYWQKVFGVQFYTENDTDENLGKMSSRMETIKFFLNCISLLVGRLDNKQLENAVSESGLQASNFLLSLVGNLVFSESYDLITSLKMYFFAFLFLIWIFFSFFCPKKGFMSLLCYTYISCGGLLIC